MPIEKIPAPQPREDDGLYDGQRNSWLGSEVVFTPEAWENGTLVMTALGTQAAQMFKGVTEDDLKDADTITFEMRIYVQKKEPENGAS